MDKALTADNCHAFIKELAELGGVHYVDPDLIIHSSADDAPVSVKTGIPPKRKPIAVFKVGMKAGDYVVLNPFTDVVVSSPERAWFTNKMCAITGALLSHLVCQVIRVGLEKSKDAGYKANKFVSRWADKIDQKLLDEARRIDPTEWGKIVYDRSKRTAQLQSDVGLEQTKNKYANKIRKASWPVFVDMIKTLLGLPQNKKPESLMYETKIASIPKIDAILHLLVTILERLDDPIKIFTDIKINVKSLRGHVDNLQAYVEATSWFASGTGTADAEAAVVPTAVAPWKDQSTAIVDPTIKAVAAVSVPGSDNAGSADAAMIASLTPVGVIYNPAYGNPATATVPEGIRPVMDAGVPGDIPVVVPVGSYIPPANYNY